MTARLRLGTRGSALALVQAGLVAELLRSRGVDVDVVTIVTGGDVRAPDTAWGEGAFVDALEAALRGGDVDVAVHSAKDVPIGEAGGPDDLVVAAYPERVDPRDALVTRDGGATLRTLPQGASVGTDSPRRTGFVLAERPDLRLVPLHGNVDTRLRRLDGGLVDALVLAAAGLHRLGRVHRIDEGLEPATVPPAPGQGALAVQVRAGDEAARSIVGGLDDPTVRMAVEAERSLLQALGGGCRAPVGAFADPRDGGLVLVAGVVGPDGSDRHVVQARLPLAGARAAAREVAAQLGGRNLETRR
jgi:hydroxymethylbilane synthase